MLILAAAAVYTGRTITRASAAQVCDACRRPIHARSKTVGLMGNRREVFCCPACALTAHRQSGHAVRLVELTDYSTGAKLSPEAAFLVRDSDVNLCARQHAMVDEAKHTTAEHFDRCSPSILAFSTRQAGESFAAVNGGTLLSFRELAAAYQR